MAATPANPGQQAPPSPIEVLTERITKSVLNAVNKKLINNRSDLLDDMKNLLAETTPEITEKATKSITTENPEITNPECQDQFQS